MESWSACIERPEDPEGVERIIREVGFGSLYSICVHRVVHRDGSICLKYSWSPHRYAGRLEHGVCFSASKLVKYACRENWGGTGCSRSEEEVGEGEYRRLLELASLKRPESVDEIISFIRLVESLRG